MRLLDEKWVLKISRLTPSHDSLIIFMYLTSHKPNKSFYYEETTRGYYVRKPKIKVYMEKYLVFRLSDGYSIACLLPGSDSPFGLAHHIWTFNTPGPVIEGRTQV